MRRNGWILVLGAIAVLATCLAPPRVAAQATQPDSRERDGAGSGTVARLRDAIEELGLSDEQQARATRIIEELRGEVRRIRDESANDAERLRQKVRELFIEAREDLRDILSEEQQQKLREILERPPPRPAAPMPPPAESPPAQDAPPEPAPATNPASAVPQVGQAAPDFALTRLDGRPAQLGAYKGKVLVLLFGNYSSPSFRQRMADYEKLRRGYSGRAEFLIVYTRESHPVGGWEVERNKHDKIAVEQPRTETERRQLAQQAKQTLKITMPIAIDAMDDSATNAFGGQTAAAVVIGRDGKIAAYRRWADPYGLRRAIDAALPHRPATSPAD